MAVPMILAFNLDAYALKNLCAGLGLRLKVVPKEGFSMPLGGMVGLPVAAPVSTSNVAFDDPMLVMCGLDGPTLDAFLKALRDSGLPPIPLKAVLTPTNAAWNALMLHEELCREHAQVTRQMENRKK